MKVDEERFKRKLVSFVCAIFSSSHPPFLLQTSPHRRTVGFGETEELENAFILVLADVDKDEEDAAFVVLRCNAEFGVNLREIVRQLEGGGRRTRRRKWRKRK